MVNSEETAPISYVYGRKPGLFPVARIRSSSLIGRIKLGLKQVFGRMARAGEGGNSGRPRNLHHADIIGPRPPGNRRAGAYNRFVAADGSKLLWALKQSMKKVL